MTGLKKNQQIVQFHQLIPEPYHLFIIREQFTDHDYNSQAIASEKKSP